MNQHVLFSHGHLAASISMAGEEAKDLVPHEKGPGSHALVLYMYIGVYICIYIYIHPNL